MSDTIDHLNDDSEGVLNTTGTYIGILKIGVPPYKEISVEASDRRDAIQKMLGVLWKERLGNTKKILVVPDHFGEVGFDPDMRCNDPLYNYLPDEVVRRIVTESKGVIGIDHNYPNSRCQLVRLKAKDYTKESAKEARARKEEQQTLRITTKITAPLLQKSSKPPPSIWARESKILPTEKPRAPTLVIKSEFHSKDGDRPVRCSIPLHEMTFSGS